MRIDMMVLCGLLMAVTVLMVLAIGDVWMPMSRQAGI